MAAVKTPRTMAAEPPVLDAFALIALVAGEPAAADVEALLRGGEAVMSVLNLAEAQDRLLRGGIPAADLARVVDPIVETAVRLVGLDAPAASAAATLRARHYSARRRPVSLADCVCVQTALVFGGAVATNDRALLDLCADEGVAVIDLPR